jgi:uncharacterized protein YggE
MRTQLNALRAGVLVLLAALALTACQRRPTLLAVNASATTRTTPDLAIVTLGVVARGATAREAQAAQATRMNAVMEAVRAAGVEEAEVQTVGYGLDPVYAYPRGGAPRIASYQSRNSVAIRVRNLNAISALIDATVADGANELQGIQFTFQDEEASLDAARAQAVQTARTRRSAMRRPQACACRGWFQSSSPAQACRRRTTAVRAAICWMRRKRRTFRRRRSIPARSTIAQT